MTPGRTAAAAAAAAATTTTAGPAARTIWPSRHALQKAQFSLRIFFQINLLTKLEVIQQMAARQH